MDGVEKEKISFLELFRILREPIKLISTWRKFFTQITISLILPLSFIFLAHMELSHLFLGKIFLNQTLPHHTTQSATPSIFSLLFQILIAAVIFSLFSTSAVVYTIAWKRLFITSLSTILSLLAFTSVFTIIFRIIERISLLNYLLTPSLQILFFVGYFYLTCIWQLSSIVSVLEDCCGFKAMKRSRDLMKGKMAVAGVMILLVGVPAGAVRYVFGHVVVGGAAVGAAGRGVLGIMCMLSVFVLFLLKLVMETTVYFVSTMRVSTSRLCRKILKIMCNGSMFL